MFGYIYKIECKVNGKLYIGQHRGEWGSDNYYTGGFAIKSAIKKYGKHNFTRTLVEECKSRKELNERERYYISKLNTQCPNGYNITGGGDGLFNPTEDVLNTIVTKTKLWRETHPEEMERLRKIASINTKGRKWCNNGIVQRQVTIEIYEELINTGWKHGMLPITEEKRNNLSKSHEGKKRSKESIDKQRKTISELWKQPEFRNKTLSALNNSIGRNEKGQFCVKK